MGINFLHPGSQLLRDERQNLSTEREAQHCTSNCTVLFAFCLFLRRLRAARAALTVVFAQKRRDVSRRETQCSVLLRALLLGHCSTAH
jgi:hypothetical protein